MKRYTARDVVKLRQRLKLSQDEFWSRIFITQSGGSRYESGRAIPKPVQALIALCYGTSKERGALVKELTS
jgi:DNA-binding transcriptional regulator YiaG